jgi:Asp-tRNA(Asn)/Glu-tRNA(Gln) amidotransferase A subunit family amidase
MRKSEIADLPALALRERMLAGALRASEVADAFLARVDEREAEVGAWTFLDRELVRKQAEAADRQRGTGRATGMLHGLPVGVKDIIDTAGMPTENGTPIDAGRRPGRDATIVRRLREAGAVIMGKTVTTELASMEPRGTRHPFDATRTPGGSSSGSAAAVATGMVPLAVGTQTGGSVIRPASFCGVVGFKPTFGVIPRRGVLPQATPLDTIGVFARTIADAALLADALAGHDPEDPDSLMQPPPRLLDVALSKPPVTPALAFVKTPAWNHAEEATKEGFAELVEALGKSCEEVALPSIFEQADGAIRVIQRVGKARHYNGYMERGREQLSDFMRGAIEEGLAISAVDYLTALDWQRSLAVGIEPLFDKYDAIVTPAAPGEAPSIDTTGNPVFNALWTLCGTPAVTLPLLQGPNGLPVGVQLVGRRGEDARLLRTARWLAGVVEGERDSSVGMAAA